MNPLRPEQIRLILVETMGEANLGAVARSMACFGVTDLWLVRPRVRVGQQAANWACHGAERLEHLQTVDDLGTALQGVDLSVALTGKSGKRRHRLVTPVGLVEEVIPRFQLGRLALVYGNEESGLDNSDIAICHWRVKIPTDPVHSSLNLAHSVSLMLYELVGRYNQTDLGSKPKRWATPEELQRALAEVGQFLEERGYPNHQATLPEELRKLNDLLHRTSLERWEVNFLLGIVRHLRNYELGRLTSKS
jgi:TrmH family RNA methyltransferase